MVATKTKVKSKPERDAQARILNVFRRIPWIHVERNNTGSLPDRFGRYVTYGLGRGSADLICFVAPHGRCLALEVKKVGLRATKDQAAWHEGVRSVGVTVAVVTTVDEACAVALAMYRDGRRLIHEVMAFESSEEANDRRAEREIEAAKAAAASVETTTKKRRQRKLTIAKGPTSNAGALF